MQRKCELFTVQYSVCKGWFVNCWLSIEFYSKNLAMNYRFITVEKWKRLDWLACVTLIRKWLCKMNIKFYKIIFHLLCDKLREWLSITKCDIRLQLDALNGNEILFACLHRNFVSL